MDNILRYLSGICLTLVFCICCNKQTIETIVPSGLPQVHVPADLDSVIEIKSWLAIGPFEFNPRIIDPANSFFYNDLRRYNIQEGMMNDKIIERLQRRRGLNTFLINESSPKISLFNYVSGKKERMSNFYIATCIRSDKAQDVMLICDGSNSYSIWLNSEKLVEVRGKYNTNKTGDRFVNITLNEGENILFIKINRWSNMLSWDFICAITSCQEGERIFNVNYAGDFVVNPITNNSLRIYAGSHSNGKIEVINREGEILVSDTFFHQNTNVRPFIVSNLNELDDGFYKTILTVAGKKIEEMIYKGDYNKFVEQVKVNVANINDSSPNADDLIVAMQRVDFVNSKSDYPYSPSETRFNNRNKVFWGHSLYSMLTNNASTKLMTYGDAKDNSGVFLFHNGSNLTQKIPLVFIIPYALEGEKMIEDWYISNLDQIAADNILADQYGLAVAWIYADGKNYSAIKTKKEITAILTRLNAEYDIDDQRIYIMGDCDGGRRTLVQIAISDVKYAACALAYPITLSGGDDGIPIELMSQMGNIPIIIKHGINDEVSPVENSRRFYAEAQKHGIPVEYIENEDSHISINKDFRRFAFEFFYKNTKSNE